jgi:hypothetical protein
MVKTEIGFKLGKNIFFWAGTYLYGQNRNRFQTWKKISSSGLVHIIEGVHRNDMSQELRKSAVRLWRYGQNTDFLTPSPYLNTIDLQKLWDHSQSIPSLTRIR